MVLPPSLLDSSHPSTSGCVEIIDFLTQSGFEIQGLKMATFSPDLARELLALYDCEDSVSVSVVLAQVVLLVYLCVVYCKALKFLFRIIFLSIYTQ